MRILFLVHRCPHPPMGGDRIRSLRFLEHMSTLGSVHLATLCEKDVSEESKRTLGALCSGTTLVRWGRFRRWIRGAFSFFMGKPVTEGMFGDPILKKKIRELAKKESFDVVFVFCSSMFQYAKLFDARRTKIIVDLVDVDSQKWFDYAQKTRGWRKLIFRSEGRRLRRLEQKIAHESDFQIVVTQEEADLYRSFAPGDFLTPIRNGVDLNFFSPPEKVEKIPFRAVFTGVMSYRANIDGIEWLAKNVLGRVRESIPDFELDVVGRDPSAALHDLARRVPGLNIIGEVPDIRPYLFRAEVALIPLRIARGIQNKVLEACAAKLPVVASPPAVEGIKAEPKRDLLVCDGADAWVETLVELFSNAELKRRLGTAGRCMAERWYTWENQLKKLDEILMKEKRLAKK
ncbi:MAG: TIGR03087 family PEP-CTERM/XrtA system glycosyltransferase [Planctomycetia bacterium]|nr:TIGR03087 family PEP-CTERM/XrtA system glycosyltransferase [Planctomycetia bacterium]